MGTVQKVHPTIEERKCIAHRSRDMPNVQIFKCSNEDIFARCRQYETQEETLAKTSREEQLSDPCPSLQSLCKIKKETQDSLEENSADPHKSQQAPDSSKRPAWPAF